MVGGRTYSVRQRNFAYAALGLSLLVASVPFGRLEWNVDAWIHTVLDTIATVLALTVGADTPPSAICRALPMDTLKIDRGLEAELGVNSTALSLIEGIRWPTASANE